MIEIKKIKKSFDKNQVLRGINLNIEKGKTTVIIGPSGCGKSVLLKLIIGLLRPDSGEILVDGINITKLSEKELYKMRGKFGFLFQSAALFDSMTVAENVSLGLVENNSRITKEEIDKIVEEKLELVGMQDSKDLLPDELSGGMRKRVALARGLVLDPELILLDEPSAGLDPVIASVVDELIISLTQKTKATSITVTHEMESAFRIATRMAMLYEGKIIQEGEPKEFKESKNPVVAQFLSGSTEGPILEGSLDAITKK